MIKHGATDPDLASNSLRVQLVLCCFTLGKSTLRQLPLLGGVLAIEKRQASSSSNSEAGLNASCTEYLLLILPVFTKE